MRNTPFEPLGDQGKPKKNFYTNKMHSRIEYVYFFLCCWVLRGEEASSKVASLAIFTIFFRTTSDNLNLNSHRMRCLCSRKRKSSAKLTHCDNSLLSFSMFYLFNYLTLLCSRHSLFSCHNYFFASDSNVCSYYRDFYTKYYEATKDLSKFKAERTQVLVQVFCIIFFLLFSLFFSLMCSVFLPFLHFFYFFFD